MKRKQTRSKLDQKQARESAPPVVEDPTPGFKKKLIDCFHKVHRVNRRHARILNLHYQGYSTLEICDKLGVTENNMYVLLMRARKALAICLGKGETNQ
jgi:DNA-directed RNA polymerase specialized sigma24 family protein